MGGVRWSVTCIGLAAAKMNTWWWWWSHWLIEFQSRKVATQRRCADSGSVLPVRSCAKVANIATSLACLVAESCAALSGGSTARAPCRRSGLIGCNHLYCDFLSRRDVPLLLKIITALLRIGAEAPS